MKKKFFVVVSALAFFIAVNGNAYADQWFHDVQVTQVSGYSSNPTRFVWFSTNFPSECTWTPHFDGTTEPGKALTSIVLAALLAQRNVDVHMSGCDILEKPLDRFRESTSSS